jgi:hypothetical protein
MEGIYEDEYMETVCNNHPSFQRVGERDDGQEGDDHSCMSISGDEMAVTQQKKKKKSAHLIQEVGSFDIDENSENTSCWLCEYQGNRTTNEVIRYILDGIPHMSLNALVTQSKYLLDRVDVGSASSEAQIKTHITAHMLHPRVKLALQLQDMAKMQKEVGKCCVVQDVETGEKTVNTQAMRVYLTLCSQITGVYKGGEEKLTFNQSSIDK